MAFVRLEKSYLTLNSVLSAVVSSLCAVGRPLKAASETGSTLDFNNVEFGPVHSKHGEVVQAVLLLKSDRFLKCSLFSFLVHIEEKILKNVLQVKIKVITDMLSSDSCFLYW